MPDYIARETHIELQAVIQRVIAGEGPWSVSNTTTIPYSTLRKKVKDVEKALLHHQSDGVLHRCFQLDLNKRSPTGWSSDSELVDLSTVKQFCAKPVK
ncbi:hypothetical protein GQ600_16338 [Phytophthora cactorum]|nr:hypothetical protein GQ600_16338 [Phytophthora cactorum]